MSSAKWRLIALSSLLLGLAVAAARADGPPSYGNGFGPPVAQPNWQPPYPQYAPLPTPPAATVNQPPIQNPQSAYAYPPPPMNSAPPMNPPQPAYAAPAFALPQPPRAAEVIPPPRSMNGTIRDEGDCVVIEVNGQQVRLPKTALAQQQQAANSAPVRVNVGTVHGRLLQNGEPVVNCTVVIVPMHKDGATDDGGVRQPLSTVTDSYGIFGFANAPVGPYKLTWLPAGTNQWIRRIEMKPDVFVNEGQDTALKDIRMALRTIN